LFNLGYLDLLSYRESEIHRINPVAKFITTVAYLFFVVSFNRYEIGMLLPFVLYPLFLILRADLPFGYILKKVLYVSPFVIMVGIFNPIFDRQIFFSFSGINITAGWISFLSIIIKYFLTVTTVVALIGVTGFYNLCYAMNKVGVPKVFSVQLLFLYRYIFLITEEAARMIRARDLRTFGAKTTSLKVYGSLAGHLLLRSINRAERIHRSMVLRGFDGNIKVAGKTSYGVNDFIFMALWILYFLLFRFFNISDFLGKLALKVFL
jgi:cobalt/nickel transport system permease protein